MCIRDSRYAGPNHLPDLMNSYQFANYFNEGSINGGGKAIFDEDTMERIQQYMNGQITTSTIANANGNWQFHEKADVYKRQHPAAIYILQL